MRICCVLSCDAAFFPQAAAAIGTILRFPPDPGRFELAIGFIAINLQPDQLAWLGQRDVTVFCDLAELPRFNDAPDHAYAETCRPYVPWLLPGYDGYIWVDSDIRFLAAGGLQYYAERLAGAAGTVIAVQETEPAYRVNAEPEVARRYHAERIARLRRVYDPDTVQYCEYFTPFNAGLFAAHADSPIWSRYRRNLGKALLHRFDPMLEQDALNVAMIEVGGWVRAPSTMNWLCSLAQPVRLGDGTWRDPDDADRQVYVAHLTNSNARIDLPDGPATYYDVYRSVGLTE